MTKHSPLRLDRRSFLKKSGASCLTAAAAGGLTSSLSMFPAHAANVDGYRALVCVFFLGGMDNFDTLLPFDQSSYDRYAQIRSTMVAQHGGSRDRSNLLQLSPDTTSGFNGREFALPPQLSGLHTLFQQGDLAIVDNVGPLIEPVTKEQALTGSRPLPPRLFSHNDQQSVWQSNRPEGAQFGWGGLFADAAVASGANSSGSANVFTTITSEGSQLFLTGDRTRPYQVAGEEGVKVDLLEFFDDRDSPAFDILTRHFRASDFSGSNLIERDIAAAMEGSFDANNLFNEAVENRVPLTTQFPQSFLGSQLQSVAQTISLRDVMLVNRQVFFVAIGGFDTHDDQASDLPGLHTQINDAFVAFNAAMQEIGAQNDVTLFTASEFGRTLAINGDGTDHGWGGTQFVMGGAVNGREIYGTVPVHDFDHEYDVGGGRLLPSTSVEQFAEPLGNWFGLTDAELAAALPNLPNFANGTIPLFG